jgi:hypothetical protein
MGFLRRIFGGGGGSSSGGSSSGGGETTAGADDAGERGSADPDAEERQHELDVLRSEAERLDELTQRQLRYAEYAWQPPPQGGEKRADDGEGSSGR